MSTHTPKSGRAGRSRAAALTIAMAMIVAACGTADTGDDATAGDDGGGDGPSLIYITPNPIGVNKFLELGQVGTERVADELGGTARTFESTDDSSRRANIEAAIDEAPDVIVLTTFTLVEMADEFSKANPDQEFILIDACPEEPAANLHCGVFREHEGAYLLGIMAGNLTETGQIGSVGAIDIPFLHRWTDSFALGAQSIDSSITDTQMWIGGDNPFSDPARAKEQALALAARGADNIFAVGAGSNGGIFEAAMDVDFLTYGVDVNQCPEAPGHVVDNNLKLVDVLVEQLAQQVLDGTAGGVVSFGLAEGGTGVVALSDDLADSGCVIAEHPDIVDQVRQAAQDIIDGNITVPDPLAAG